MHRVGDRLELEFLALVSVDEEEYDRLECLRVYLRLTTLVFFLSLVTTVYAIHIEYDVVIRLLAVIQPSKQTFSIYKLKVL